MQEEVGRLLADVVRDGRTVFFSSHVLSEVERLSEAVAIIREGRIVAVEEIVTLKSRSVNLFEVTFQEAPPLQAFASVPGVREVRRAGRTLHLQARDGIDPLVKALARYTVIDLRTEQPSLEDVFLAYYAGREDGAAEMDEEERRASA
jgi:ABC-2 type transport system ATP-binding protein